MTAAPAATALVDTALVDTVATADGPFTLLVADDGAVLAAGWSADAEAVRIRIPAAQRPGRLREEATDASDAVRAYYAGELAAIDAVPVRAYGTPLQRAGWDALRRIEAGHPLTYTQFAAAFGRPAAVRAAASICARNAPALFVPCHRVLRTDGSLGGFAWGLGVKRSLLARERD